MYPLNTASTVLKHRFETFLEGRRSSRPEGRRVSKRCLRTVEAVFKGCFCVFGFPILNFRFRVQNIAILCQNIVKMRFFELYLLLAYSTKKAKTFPTALSCCLVYFHVGRFFDLALQKKLQHLKVWPCQPTSEFYT